MKNLIIKDSFFKQAPKLRNFFEDQFRDPHQSHQKRFVWDYWNVPDQYRLLRTPAYHYFPEKLYQQFHSELVQWGRQNLGCHDISPPWLSYYVEGCRQSLHSDVPHGPWAFVYSISPKQIKFQGGETLILKDQVLDYWKNFVDEEDREQKSFVDRIAPKFNRLVVFDPKKPHGVTEVRGVEDPRQARLVIHGWFVQPRPYVQGALSTKEVQDQLEHLMYDLSEKLSEFGSYWGTISFGIDVSAKGQVLQVKVLTDTLVSTDQQSQPVKKMTSWFFTEIKKSQFKAKPKGSRIVVPLIFK